MLPTTPNNRRKVVAVPLPIWDHTFAPFLTAHDPPPRTGRPRADSHACLNGILYRLQTGCRWNQLPEEFGSDTTVFRTLRRWEEKGVFDLLWSMIESQLAEPVVIHREWRTVHGDFDKSRFIGQAGARVQRRFRRRRRTAA